MKDELMRLIEAGRKKEAETLLPQVDDSEPAEAGVWTAKDNVAHPTAWPDDGATELESVPTGAGLPAISPDDDVENARIYSRTHALPAGEIVDAAGRSWDRLAAALQACTEEQLHGPRPRYPEQEAYEILAGSSFNHLTGHLSSWFQEAGDQDEALNAVMWARDLAASAPVGDRTRGAAEYNVGCHFARLGRAEEALPYLARGIELRPDLRELALTDTDLDPIRDRPEVATLLEG